MPKSKNHKSGLKNALFSQQGRLKKNEQAKRAAQAAEQRAKQPSGARGGRAKGKGGRPDGGSSQQQSRVTIPFKPTDKILLVGEGNFTFARALVSHSETSASTGSPLQFLPAANITATAYDSEEECYDKYADARSIVTGLRERGVQVFFGVDATRLEKCAALKGAKFDRVVWNFPHAGKGIADQDRNILANQVLLLGFLRSAPHVLVQGPMPVAPAKRKHISDDDDEEDASEALTGSDDEAGETTASRGSVLITLRNVPPYTLWNLPKLAKSPPPPQISSTPPNPRYKLLQSFKFVRAAWPGYAHRMTKGERAGGTGKTGVGGEDRTWEFCLAD